MSQSKLCDSTLLNGGFQCTQLRGHTGQHEAGGTEPLIVWHDSDGVDGSTLEESLDELGDTIADRMDELSKLTDENRALREALTNLTQAVLLITDQSDSGRLEAIERLHRDGAVIETARAMLAAEPVIR